MRYIVLIIVFISYLFSSINEIEKSVFTKEELEWIKNNPVVKVGVDEDWPPFDYVDGGREA